MCFALLGVSIEFRPDSMDFFPNSLTCEGSSGCVVALNQVVENMKMFDDCG